MLQMHCSKDEKIESHINVCRYCHPSYPLSTFVVIVTLALSYQLNIYLSYKTDNFSHLKFTAVADWGM